MFFQISETAASTAEQQTSLQAHEAGQLCAPSRRHKAGEGLKPWVFLFVQTYVIYTPFFFIPLVPLGEMPFTYSIILSLGC